MRMIGKAAIAFVGLLLMAAGPAGSEVPAGPAVPKWTAAWTASMWKSTNDQQHVAVNNATLRFSIRAGAGGDQIRLKLSNEYGAAFRIGAASIRIGGSAPVPITFGKKGAVDVAANAVIVTDATKVKVQQFDVIEVAIYLPGEVRLNTVHGAGGDKTSISPEGDFTRTSFEPARRTDFRPLLAGVEVLGKAQRPVVVAYGDSITDNTGCAMTAMPMCRWGDVLGQRFAKAGMPHVVVTQAISGNRVLSMGSGPPAVERFDRDVLALPGVTHVILLEGVNDIGGSGRARPDGTSAPVITAEQLIDGYRRIVARAHSKGIKVMCLTILPFEGAGYHTPAGEVLRGQANAWLSAPGNCDASFDMAAVVATPGSPLRLDPALQRGDNLHPDGRGETKMGEAIPLDWFK